MDSVTDTMIAQIQYMAKQLRIANAHRKSGSGELKDSLVGLAYLTQGALDDLIASVEKEADE